MKRVRVICAISVLLLAGVRLGASGQIGVYAIVEKVVFEPNDGSPERLQIWGVFVVRDGGLDGTSLPTQPQRGYLYFSLPSADVRGFASDRAASKREWADFKTIAGTGQAIAFGNLSYLGRFSDTNRLGVHIRREKDKPSNPDSYHSDMGIVKLGTEGNHALIVTQLRQLLRK